MLIKFGSTNFWVPKIFEKVLGPKKFESEKILGLKKFWLKKNWVPKYCLVGKNSGSKKFLGPKKFWVKKIFGSKNILGPNNCGSKKFESEKYFESKIFGPPLPTVQGKAWQGLGGTKSF